MAVITAGRVGCGMAKRLVQMRLEPDLVEWLDGYAGERASSRTAVVEAALESFRAEAAGGDLGGSGQASSVDTSPDGSELEAAGSGPARPGAASPRGVSGPAAPAVSPGVARAEAFRRMAGR